MKTEMVPRAKRNNYNSRQHPGRAHNLCKLFGRAYE